MRRLSLTTLGMFVVLFAPAIAFAAASQPVQLTGEVIDPWCYLSEIMYAEGTAHHQCAIWCAAGGIPSGLLTEAGDVYFIVGFEGRATTLADAGLLDIQTHQITVDGSFFEKDGLKYLVVDEVLKDEGIVNLTHDEYGIQPFGE